MTQKKSQLAVIGLGYVGLPVAAAFAQKRSVIAFDINPERVAQLQAGLDKTGELTRADLTNSQLILTSDAQQLNKADIFIVAVPTPIDHANQPDFSYLISASRLIGQHLKPGAIVVYESTVYPGATEEVCGPVLEQVSGLKSGVDFFLAYSPERINPGDREHTFRKVRKVVSAQTPLVLDIVAELYGEVVEAGICRASSIRVAEAAKVIENTQRDLNIALINELAMLFNTLDIDTHEVLETAASKWNFLPFKPGLVGGHCIGVDPYYLTHKAITEGFHPQVILAGRRTNDQMGKYVADQTIKHMIHGNIAIKQAKVVILGLTFKENCPDIRNSKVVDIFKELRDFGVDVSIHDPYADVAEVQHAYGLTPSHFDNLPQANTLILAVPHRFYLQKPLQELTACLKNSFKLIIDIKSVLPRDVLTTLGIQVWRL